MGAWGGRGEEAGCSHRQHGARCAQELVRKEGGKAVRAACLAFVEELKETVMKGHEPPPQKARD